MPANMDDKSQGTNVPTVSGEWMAFPPNLRFVKKIGQGGIAKIYKAVQDNLEREVAVKLLTIPTKEHTSRFEREAKLMSELQHENITSIHDFYKENSRLYMVMELVEGVDLKEILEDGTPFPPEIATIVAIRIARALEYIHNRKIIHRDIKPGNIMLSYNGNVKLMDFGIALNLLENAPEDDDDMGIGTPAYISPEQLRGEDVDGRSDIYSLGVVLYRMLTGIKPFVYRTENTLFSKIQFKAPMPPRSLIRSIPKALDAIIMKCLEKSPDRRYCDAASMERDLENYIRKINPQFKSEFLLIEFLASRKKLEKTQTDTIMKKLSIKVSHNNSYPNMSLWAIISLLLALALVIQTILLFTNTI
jgi:eukaryotic-like serine/threonine-protein kinase